MTTTRPFLPFALPDIGPAEIAAVVDVLRSGWLTTGPRAKAFEKAFGEAVDARHSLAVNSATSGLHLALEAIGVREGDQVITSPYTFTATGEVVRYLGADLLLADVEPGTSNLDPVKVRALLEDLRATNPARYARIRAILPVHFAGQACNMTAFSELAREHGLRVVEDAAHALPCTHRGVPIGRIGDVTVFSFYVTKPIATGEGGMVTTNDDALAERMRVMRLHGINRDVWDRYTSERPAWYYEVVAPGYKYNMPDLAAALGVVQLERITELHSRRRAIAEAYVAAFSDDPRMELPVPILPDDVHAWHLFPIHVAPAWRDSLIRGMAERGIGTSVHFIPLHVHPYYRDRYGWRPDDFPVANERYLGEVSLPIYSKMTDGDVERVVGALRDTLDGLERG